MMIFTRTTILLLLPLLLTFLPSQAKTLGLLRKDMSRIFESSSFSSQADANNMTEFGDIFFGSYNEHSLKMESALQSDVSLSLSFSMSMEIETLPKAYNATSTKSLTSATTMVQVDEAPMQIMYEEENSGNLKGRNTTNGKNKDSSGAAEKSLFHSTVILLLITGVVFAHWW